MTKIGPPQGAVPAAADEQSGKYVASLNKLVKWLASKAEALGVQVFPEIPGQELLYDGERVIGVRIGDKGVDKQRQAQTQL